MTPVKSEPFRLNWYLVHSLVKVISLPVTANFKFAKIFGSTGEVFEGLPIATKATFSPPNSPLAKKTIRFAPLRSSV